MNSSSSLDQLNEPEQKDPTALLSGTLINIEAEEAVISILMNNHAAYERIADVVRIQHFSDPFLAKLYAHSLHLIESDQPANAVTLKAFMQENPLWENYGGASYLAKLQANPLLPQHVRFYGELLVDLYDRRELVRIAQDIVSNVQDVSAYEKADQVVEFAERKLFDLAERGEIDSGLHPFLPIMRSTIDSINQAYSQEGGDLAVSTGLKDVDDLLGGMYPSDLLIIAGRPGMGKTALATTIAYKVASRKGKKAKRGERAISEKEYAFPVAFFSLEMSSEQLATRLLSARAEVASDALRRGTVLQEELDRVFPAAKEMEDMPLYIDETPGLTVAQLRLRARRMVRTCGLSLIVVDYLQLMRGSHKAESRVLELGEITRGLKGVAKELNVPILALSQLSRSVENREDKRPHLADLRESGTIEQDSDVVMFVYREQYYLEQKQPRHMPEEKESSFQERLMLWQTNCDKVHGLAEVNIAKHRHGPTGKKELHFDGRFARFSNHIPDSHAPSLEE